MGVIRSCTCERRRTVLCDGSAVPSCVIKGRRTKQIRLARSDPRSASAGRSPLSVCPDMVKTTVPQLRHLSSRGVLRARWDICWVIDRQSDSPPQSKGKTNDLGRVWDHSAVLASTDADVEARTGVHIVGRMLGHGRQDDSRRPPSWQGCPGPSEEVGVYEPLSGRRASRTAADETIKSRSTSPSIRSTSPPDLESQWHRRRPLPLIPSRQRPSNLHSACLIVPGTTTKRL
jgi:hypothetical protein